MKVYRRDFVDGEMKETELASGAIDIIIEDSDGSRIFIATPMILSSGWFEVRTLNGVFEILPQAENSILVREKVK